MFTNDNLRTQKQIIELKKQKTSLEQNIANLQTQIEFTDNKHRKMEEDFQQNYRKKNILERKKLEKMEKMDNIENMINDLNLKS